MRIILDTDEKTITVPHNYGAKLAKMNEVVKSVTDDETKLYTFQGYLQECWDYAMKHSDTNLKTASKPAPKKKKED